MRIRWLAACALVLAPALTAQEPQLRVTVSGGRATDLRGVKGDAIQVAPALTFFPNHRSWITLGGRGTRFLTDEWSIAGAVATGARVPLNRRMAVSMAVSGDAAHASFGATYL